MQPALASIGAGNSARPSNATCVFSQVVAKAPSNITCQVLYSTATIYTVSGKSAFGQAPQPQDVVNKLFANGTTTEVFYMEIWQHDVSILGVGYTSFTYIAVCR